MGNKVKYNLKNVHAAKLTKNNDGNFTYDTPKPIPGAVSISLDAEGSSNPFYADGIVYFRSTSNNGYSGDLEIALIPEWFRTDTRMVPHGHPAGEQGRERRAGGAFGQHRRGVFCADV